MGVNLTTQALDSGAVKVETGELFVGHFLLLFGGQDVFGEEFGAQTGGCLVDTGRGILKTIYKELARLDAASQVVSSHGICRRRRRGTLQGQFIDRQTKSFNVTHGRVHSLLDDGIGVVSY
jgi:hypothetical protein